MSSPIKTWDIEELSVLLKELDQPAFRSKQLYQWFHQKHVFSYEAMTNIPQSLREVLQNRYPLNPPRIIETQESSDGTRKFLLELSDGAWIETVGIPEEKSEDKESGAHSRLSVCVSTQVGCAMGCAFCATGQEGFTRNLTTDEIVDQVYLVADSFNRRVSNVVFMGQGEPFLNYVAVIKALHILNDPQGLAIGARKITVSTCGIIAGIRRFSQEPEQFVLALSLHSAVQEKRNLLMPQVRNQPLNQLKDALKYYQEKAKRRITFEYLLLDGFNDGEDDLMALLEFCQGLLCHINFLRLNKVPGAVYQASSPQTFKEWTKALEKQGVEATTRLSRGADISGACGQLKNTHLLID